MHEFMLHYCPSHCSLRHKFTSGYNNDACFGFIFVAKTGTLLLYPVYYEISGYDTFTNEYTVIVRSVVYAKTILPRSLAFTRIQLYELSALLINLKRI